MCLIIFVSYSSATEKSLMRVWLQHFIDTKVRYYKQPFLRKEGERGFLRHLRTSLAKTLGLNLMNLYPIVGHCTKKTYMYALGPKNLAVAHPNFPIILWLNSMIGNFNVDSINPHQKY